MQAIFDAHGWSPYRDPRWVTSGSVGGRTAADGILTGPYPSIFDSRDYVFQDLTELRRHRLDHSMSWTVDII